MSDIDPVQFGKLINAVETLETQVKELSGQVQSLNQQITGGKGIVAGMLLAAGGLGAAATKLLENWLK
jgi:hypothetical protein